MTVESDNGDAPVFCPASLKLGEIHWYILSAANLMDAKTSLKRKVSGTTVVQYERTDFGREVGRDEINWWVFKKATSIDDLRGQSQRALAASESLKSASGALKKNRPQSYAELLNTLRRFAEDHIAEIDTLHEYVRWLAARDTMAPKILYTYRVWGSTRMSDRWVEVGAGTPERESSDAIRHLTAVVLGLTSSRLRTLDRAYLEVGDEIWSSTEFDEETGSAEIEVPMARVVPRVSQMVYDECAIYFMCLRDSLRNILLDIDKFVEQRDLVNDDAFWRAFVEKAVRTEKTETQLWDFKETLTMWRVEKGPEMERAKVAFSEDVASFANARGGVLVIGVTDRREIVGIADTRREVENRLKFASDVLARHLEYSRPIVRFHQVVLSGSDGFEKTCLVVVVAQASEVAGVNDGQAHYTYPVRRETGITRVSRHELMTPKLHMKSDNYDFLCDLNQFVLDK